MHRELLDYLALQFMHDGWSTKQLVAQLVRTEAYRRSSQIQPDVMIRDPENRFWWRANRRRMDLEAYRDAC